MKIPLKLKPVLSCLIGILAILLAYEIVGTSFYEGADNPGTFEYHLALAEAYTGQIQQTLTQYGKWQEKEDGEWFFQPGDQTLALALKALREYHKAIEINPAQARSHLLLAWYYGTTLNNLSNLGFRTSDFGVGISESNPHSKFLSTQHSVLSPVVSSPVVSSPQSSALSTQSFLGLAKAEFDQATKLDPHSSNIRRVYGTWAFQQAQADRTWLTVAVKEYRQAVELDPSLAKEALTHYLAYAWHLDRLKEILPDNFPEVLPTLANFLYDNGYWELNEPEFLAGMKQQKEQFKRNNHNGEGAENLFAYYKTLAAIYDKKQERSRAISLFEDYLELEPMNSEANFRLAGYSFNNRPWSFSQAHYLRALALAPEKAHYHSWYGHHLCQKQEFKEAVNQLKIALELQSTDGQARNWLMECYKKIDEYGLSENQLPVPMSKRTD